MRATVTVHLEPDDHIDAIDLYVNDPQSGNTVCAKIGRLSILGTADEIEAAMRRILADVGKIRTARARAATLVNAGTSGLSSATGVRACAACADPVECSLVGCDHGAVA